MTKTSRLISSLLLAIIVTAPMLSYQGHTQAQGNVEIVFVHIYPDERDIRRTTIEEIAAAFMAEHPNVTVTIQTTTDDYTEVFEGALRAASQGNPPHLVQVEDSLTQIAIDSQFFVKIGDYATEEQQAIIDDIISPMRNFYNLDNDIWGIPWNASNPVMYYNPDLFVTAGLDPDNPPQTFAEITAACEALMSAEIEGLEACINWPVNSWLPEQWVAMQNALFVDQDNGRSGRATEAFLDSPAMLTVFNWWKDLADRGYYTYSGVPNAYTPEGLIFITKKTAIHLSTSAGLSNILKFGESMGKFSPRVAPFPMPHEEATNGITAGGAALWVMSGHPDEETQAAVDFAFYLLSTDNMSTWHKASGYFPIRQSSIDQLTAEGWFNENPFYRIALDQLLNSTPNPANAGAAVGPASQIREAVTQAALSIIDNGEDPTTALAAAKARADKAIAEYNSVIGG